jgi:hypothetical protein
MPRGKIDLLASRKYQLPETAAEVIPLSQIPRITFKEMIYPGCRERFTLRFHQRLDMAATVSISVGPLRRLQSHRHNSGVADL